MGIICFVYLSHYPLSAPEAFYSLYRDMTLPAAYDTDPDQQLKHPVMDKMRKFWNYDSYFEGEGRAEGYAIITGCVVFSMIMSGRVLEAWHESGDGDNTQIIIY